MKIITNYAHPDEPCYGLYEGPRNIPQSGSRWIQAVYVVRGDALAEYTEDFGAAGKFPRIQPLLMPSPHGENTVGELRDFAAKNRTDEYWANRREEMLAESTLVRDAIRQVEQMPAVVLNRSVFGPGITVQRNGVPQKVITKGG